MNARIAWIDTLKGMGILLVMLGHIVSTKNPLYSYIYSFHIWVFFLACGYLSAAGRPDGFVPFLRRKAATRLAPYAFFVGISYLVFLARLSGQTGLTIPELVVYNDYGPYLRDWVLGLFSGDRAWLAQARNDTLWFLPCLFLAEVLLFGILAHGADRPVHPSVLLVVLSVAAYALEAAFPSGLWWSADRVPRAVFYCVLGSQLRRAFPPDEALSGGRRLMTAVAALGMLSIGTAYLYAHAAPHSSLPVRYLALIVPGVAGSLFLSGAARLVGARAPGVSYFGKNSMALLGLHLLLFSAAEALVLKAAGLFTRSDIVASDLNLFLIVFLPGLALSVPVINAVNRYAPWLVGKRREAPAAAGGA
jgi:acyltransferase